jgi:hypothetical protein
MPMPASSSALRPPSSTAGVAAKSQRWDRNGCSLQSVPAWGNTHRSSGTPSWRARSTLHMISAAAMSTSLLEFIVFVYGNPIIRLVGPGVRICSAVIALRIQAFGLAAATWEKRAHSPLMAARCSSTLSPPAARRAVSNMGYTCTGM